MAVATWSDDRDAWQGPLVSIALHLLAGVALAFIPLTQQQPHQPEEPIPIEIIAAPQFEAASKPAEPVLAQRAPSIESQGEQSRREASIPRTAPRLPETNRTGSMVRPQIMLSEHVLADPRSRKARQQLGTFAADERVVQLCNIEAMEQVHAWKPAFAPEAVVAYAFQDLKMRGGSIVADGAAFYSQRNWYRFRFECGVQADKVVSFAFSVGDAVPRADWEANSLAEQMDDDD